MTETETQTATVETFTFKHPDTKDAMELPAKIGDLDVQDFLGKVIDKSKGDMVAKVQTMSAEMNNLKQLIADKTLSTDELNKKLQTLEDEKLTAEELAGKKSEREMVGLTDQINGLNDSVKHYQKLFEQEKITKDIYDSMNGHKLHNARQAALLFQGIAQPKLTENEGVYKTVVTWNEKEVDPKAAFDEWIVQPENSNLLTNSLKPGSGSTTGSADGESSTFTRDQLKDPVKMAAYHAKVKAGEDVKIIG